MTKSKAIWIAFSIALAALSLWAISPDIPSWVWVAVGFALAVNAAVTVLLPDKLTGE